jgi:hypothetical protein
LPEENREIVYSNVVYVVVFFVVVNVVVIVVYGILGAIKRDSAANIARGKQVFVFLLLLLLLLLLLWRWWWWLWLLMLLFTGYFFVVVDSYCCLKVGNRSRVNFTCCCR